MSFLFSFLFLSFISIATTPSLRDTSPQGEAFRLPLRGAVGNADRGGLATFYLFSTLATTPHFGHLSSRRGFSAPFEGSCRQRRLRGGLLSFIFSLHLPPLRHFGHLSSRRGFSAPFEGSCRQRRLRGGISHRKNYIHNFITFHPHCQAANITLILRFA